MKTLLLFGFVSVMIFAKNSLAYSQDYVPYIQGNSGRIISVMIPWFLPDSGTTYKSEYWIGIDTTINDLSYTTKIVSLLESNPSSSLYLREDSLE